MDKRTEKQQDAIATRLMIHMTMAFLFALTIMYISRAYNAAGVINGIDSVRSSGRIMFFIGLAVLAAGVIYSIFGKIRNWNFSEKILSVKIAVIWPAVYTLTMASLAFTYWDYEAIFHASYMFLAAFLILFIIYYVFPIDTLYASTSAFLSVLLMYIAENIPSIVSRTIGGHATWYTHVWKSIFSGVLILAAAVFIYYMVSLRKNKGTCKRCSRQMFPKTAIYWPCIGVGVITILGNLAFIIAKVYFIYTMYVMLGFAIVFAIVYLARLLFNK